MGVCLCQTGQESSLSADDDTTLFELYHVLFVEDTKDVSELLCMLFLLAGKKLNAVADFKGAGNVLLSVGFYEEEAGV